MEFLKVQYTRIQEQLSGLSASQKMLTASLVAIMVMTLFWWSHYAAEPEMDSVVSQSLTADDIGMITSHLDGKGIHYKVVGDKVMVPTDRKLEVLADLTYSQSLPRNVKLPFDDMITKINPLSGPEITDQMMLEAKQRTLAMVICQFPGVGNATVVIDPTTERRLDNTSVQASAMVNISTRHDGRESPKQLAQAAANMVAGAEAGLTPSRINIVIDGAPFAVQDKDDGENLPGDGTIVDARRQHEKYYCDKIRGELNFINGLMVSVTVNLDTSYTDTTEYKVDPKNLLTTPIHTKETSEETNGGSGGGEPGASPNTGVAIAQPAAGGATNTNTDSETDLVEDHGKSTTRIKKSPGDAVAVAASVRVPRSYLVQCYKSENNGKEPDAATLDQFSVQELNNIRRDVKSDTGITSDDAVNVAAYNDPKPLEPTGSTSLASAAPVGSMVSSHGKDIGVGVLAVVSLFMMSMMVRKSSPAPVLVAPVEKSETNRLNADDEVAGEVGEGSTMLDGMELDEDTVKTQQMLDQVQNLVTENPDAAANLVKRWLNRT